MAALGTLLGGLIFGKDAAFGTKPDVPKVTRINPDTIQQQTVAGNQAILPQAQALAAQVNKGNAAQLRAVLNQGGQLDLAESVIGSQLRGELPKDVQQALQDSVAAQSLRLGLGGTQFQAGLGGLRGVLSSLQLQQQGLQNFQSLAQLTTPQLIGPQAMFYTNEQRYRIQNEQNANLFNRNWLQSQVNAAPSPFANAMTQAFIQDEQTIMELAGSAAMMACWVAREVYGPACPMWLLFRAWLFENAPAWFRKFYLRHGRRIATWLRDKPAMKAIIRHWMTSCIKLKYG